MFLLGSFVGLAAYPNIVKSTENSKLKIIRGNRWLDYVIVNADNIRRHMIACREYQILLISSSQKSSYFMY